MPKLLKEVAKHEHVRRKVQNHEGDIPITTTSSKEMKKVRVCKVFYLSTLDISQRRVQYHHEHKQTNFSDRRGKFPKMKIDPAIRIAVQDHIRSFPRMPSHYARKNTSKEFLEADLTLKKMYGLYKEKCEEKGKTPCKMLLYRTIFNYDFNIDFFQPKKDLCDICQ